MKLVELLARELDVWPSNATHAVSGRDSSAYFTQGGHPAVDDRDESLPWTVLRGCDECVCWHQSEGVALSKVPSDYKTAIITRADWQAERERIAGGWIAWGGGECPIDKGALIDTQHRDGQERRGSVCGQYGNRTRHMFWSHDGDQAEVIAYRLHKPEQASAEAVDAGIAAADAGQVKPIEEVKAMYEYNPIHTRNRILEIDRTTESLEEERVALVQRLADEGFVLARVDGKVAQDQPEEWRVGDLLEITGEEEGHEFEIGQIVVITRIDKDDEVMPYYCKPSSGDGEPWFVNSNEVKFHSRPAAYPSR